MTRRLLAVFAVAATLAASDAAAGSRVTIGRSVHGRAIHSIRRGSATSPVSIVVVGCIHGNECAGRAIVRALRRRSIPSDIDLRLIPSLNPDGQAAVTRQNARGVDLNRNFRRGWRPIGEPWDTYHSGSRPFSEPETRAARDFIERLRPEITIWYHQHMALVAKQPKHLPTQRRYARAVGLPLRQLEPLPGTASRWQNPRWPHHLSFGVERPAGGLGDRMARRHARAVVEAGLRWPRS